MGHTASCAASGAAAWARFTRWSTRAPEVEDGEEPTAAADTYALGVAMFKMLTGVWYESGVDVRALLAGSRWKYRWTEVLPAMLAVEPAERPQILAQAVIGLLPSAKRTQGAVKSRTRRRRWAWFVAACVCTALVAIGGLCAGVVAWRTHEGGLPLGAVWRLDEKRRACRQEGRCCGTCNASRIGHRGSLQR